MGGKKRLLTTIFNLLLICILWSISGVLLAQESTLFRHFEKKDGLSQSSVFAIAQDADGYIWLGTRDGLNKYDGYEFTTYRSTPKRSGNIIDNDVRVLYFDSLESRLWVGTIQGLSQYDSKVDTFRNFSTKEGLSSNTIRSILRDSKGNLWVGTENGLDLYLPNEKRFSQLILNDGKNTLKSIYALAETPDGQLLIGSAQGLYAFSNDKVVKPFPENNDALKGINVQSILLDNDDHLWVGTQKDGVYRYDPAKKEFKIYQSNRDVPHSLSNNSIRAMAKSPEGDIWIGSFVGLNKYIPEKDHFQHFLKDDLVPSSLSNSSIRSVFFDQRGGLWLGTYHGGANYHDPALSRFKNYEHLPTQNSLSNNVVSSFVEDKKGNFWIGTEGGGLNYFNRSTNRFTSFLSLPNQSNSISGNNVKSLLLNGDKLWIGTFNQGLNCLDLSSMTFQHYNSFSHSINNNNVYSLMKEGDKLWVLTYGGGLNLFDLKKEVFIDLQISSEDNNILRAKNGRVLLQDSRHQIWVGTEIGLNLMLRDSINDFTLESRRLFPGFRIYDLFEDKSGIIWIGTFSNGLIALDPSDFSFTQYTETDGLPGRTIFGILQDQAGRLWLSTNNGLSKFDIKEQVFSNYNYSNGLNNLEFNFNGHYKASSGEMLFGGTNGFTIFQPSEILPNQYEPPLVFTDLKVYNKKVNVLEDNSLLNKVINQTEELCFKYNEAIFSIGVSALDYFNPSNLQYAYKLEGLDNDWNYNVGQTEANYTIQRPGTYTFKVKAANSDGIWGNQERSLKITVLPPPWFSIWAYLIYALLIIGAIYGAWFFMRLRHRLQLERMAKQQQEELNEMKLRFFTNITHEFRTPLTLILGPLEEMIKRSSPNPGQKQLHIIKQNAQRLLNLVNQILSFRKLESDHEPMQATRGDIVIFVQDIFQSFTETARIRGIDYSFDSEEVEMLLWFDYDKLEKVFFNLLSNAFKFTPDKGQIKLKVEKHHNKVRISVTDNGNGIKKELQGQIFKRYYEKVAIKSSYTKGSGIGLALSKQMVELHHGALWVESEIGHGATFTVELPQGKEHFATHELSDSITIPTKVASLGTAASKAPDFTWLKETQEEAAENAPQILIVEDNQEVRQYIQSIFQGVYHIETACDGLEGLKKARQLNPSIIISDIMMPEMDGKAMCEKLKLDIKTSHIPVILLTARAAQLFKNEGLETGADDYLTKPFNPDELRLRVRNMIRSRKTMREKFVRVMNLEPKEITVTSADEAFLERAMEIAEKHIGNPGFTTEQFAYEIAVSRALLFTKMKALTNQTPNNFIKTLRMKRAAQLLGQQKLNVSEVAYKVGFKDTRYFSKCFQRQFSKTPSDYMNSL